MTLPQHVIIMSKHTVTVSDIEKKKSHIGDERCDVM